MFYFWLYINTAATFYWDRIKQINSIFFFSPLRIIIGDKRLHILPHYWGGQKSLDGGKVEIKGSKTCLSSSFSSISIIVINMKTVSFFLAEELFLMFEEVCIYDLLTPWHLNLFPIMEKMFLYKSKWFTTSDGKFDNSI